MKRPIFYCRVGQDSKRTKLKIASLGTYDATLQQLLRCLFRLFVLTGAKFSSVSFMDLKGNLKRTLNPLFPGFSGLNKSWSLGSFCFIISKNLPNPCFEILLAKVSFQFNRALAMPISAQIMRKFFASVMVRTSQKLMTPLEYLRNALYNV